MKYYEIIIIMNSINKLFITIIFYYFYYNF